MKPNGKKYYLINSCWDSHDMTAVFYKKGYWELDPGNINPAHMKLLSNLKKGYNVILAKIKKTALSARGKHLGVIKKVDLKKNRIYITWTDVLNDNITLPVKSDSPVNGPMELMFA